MPGDILKDAVQIANTTDQEAELFFQTNTDGRSEEQMNMLKKVRFEISQNKKILYKGTLDAAELAKARSLGKFKSGQKGRLEFQLEIPREWDNAYALKKTDITWIFAVKENEKKEFSSYESVGSESAGGAAQEKDIKTRRKNPVRTEMILNRWYCSFFFWVPERSLCVSDALKEETNHEEKNSGNHIGFGADIFCDGRSSGICRRQAVGKQYGGRWCGR